MWRHVILHVLTTINWGQKSQVGVRPASPTPIGKVCVLRTWYDMYGYMCKTVRRIHVYQLDTYDLSKAFMACVVSVLSGIGIL